MAKLAALLSALVMSLATAAGAANTQCLQRLASVPMEWSDQGIPHIPVTINGKEAQFFVDSTADFGYISASAARKLGIPEEHDRSDPRGEWVVAHRLEIGGTDQTRPGGTRFRVLDDVTIPNEIAGFLNTNDLTRVDVDLDYGAKKFGLFKSSNCSESDTVFWTKGPAIRLPFRRGLIVSEASPTFRVIMTKGTLDNKAVNVVVNTGNPFTEMDLALARRSFGAERINSGLSPIPRPHFPWQAKDETATYFSHSFKLLTINALTINDPEVLLVHSLAFNHDLMVGNSILSKFHIFIAYTQGVMYVTPADAH